MAFIIKPSKPKEITPPGQPKGQVVATAAPVAPVSLQGTYKDMLGQVGPIVSEAMGTTTGATPATSIGGYTPDQLAMIMKMFGGTGTSTAKKGLTTGDARMAELTYQKQKDAIAAQRLQDQIAAMTDQYTSGKYNQDITGMQGALQSMYDQSQNGINTQYDQLINSLQGGYDTAGNLVNTGYGQLNDYLKNNANNPYANMKATVGQVTNPVAQEMQGYGITDPRIAQQMAAEQQAMQAGGSAFNDLSALLSGSAQRADASRASEAQMAQTLAQTGLGSALANYKAGALTNKNNQMSQLAQMFAQQNYQLQQTAAQRKQDYINSLIQMGIDPNKLGQAQSSPSIPSGFNPNSGADFVPGYR
jgi:hypothetical protein